MASSMAAVVISSVAMLLNDSMLGCAVCFGDSESNMSRGVTAGVAVLVGVVGFVMAGVAGTGLFWIQRARRIRNESSD